MDDLALSDAGKRPHRRFNILTRSWILCSPHRASRPWQGAVGTAQPNDRPQYDPKCYLCPANTRAGSPPIANPGYAGTWWFKNDFPALLYPHGTTHHAPDDTDDEFNATDKMAVLRRRLLRSEAMDGVCMVGCFSPRHDLSLAAMATQDVRKVVDMWTSLYKTLSSGAAAAAAAAPDPLNTDTDAEHSELPADAASFIGYVQIFENKGEMMGCSNPHPHCQAWCTSKIPQEPLAELTAAHAYRQEHGPGSCLLCDYAAVEMADRSRLVYENESFVIVVPYWALWPFETLLISKVHVGSLAELSGDQRSHLAEALRTMACKFDNMFQCAFPYSMGLHQSPTSNGCAEFASSHANCSSEEAGTLTHLHAHFYPPLLRSATVRKFMVGFEMLAEPQRDITAEASAERLRSLDGEKHYNASSEAPSLSPVVET